MSCIRFIIPTFLLISLNLHGQRVEDAIVEMYNTYKAQNPIEFAYLRTDRKIYYSGERISFQLALMDQYLQPSRLSKVAYVELIHESGRYRKKYAFKIEDGLTGDGIGIPLDIPTGNYQLVSYTHFMNNFQFDQVADRAMVYIQNTADKAASVAKSFHFDTERKLDEEVKVVGNSYSIRKNETGTKVLFEITTAAKSNKICYLVSEGFRGIQFIAKVRLNKKKNNLAISKDQLKGNFQKVVLLDDSLNILGGLCYFLQDLPKPTSTYEASSDFFKMDNGIVGRAEMTSEPLQLDTIHLFKRMYQLFYNLDESEPIEELDFKKLVADSTLNEFSVYTLNHWANILSRAQRALSFLPEGNLHIRGQLLGDLSKLKGATYSVHFFDNKMDFLHLLDQTGKVDLEIPWPIKSDRFYSSITNYKEKNISGSFQIEFDQGPTINYIRNKNYYPKDLTDSLINQKIQFKYVLSTYGNVVNNKRFFWQEYIIDRVVKVSDYRGLANFEEFVREAVMDLSVVKNEGKKGLNIYNSFDGSFSAPYMVILNNEILNDSNYLFDIPLDNIKSIKMIYLKESLDQISKTITSGIVIVETSENITAPSQFLETKADYIVGFDSKEELNPISQSFSPSMFMKVQFNDDFSMSLNHSKETGSFFLNVERISQDGTYSSFQDKLEIEN